MSCSRLCVCVLTFSTGLPDLQLANYQVIWKQKDSEEEPVNIVCCAAFFQALQIAFAFFSNLLGNTGGTLVWSSLAQWAVAEQFIVLSFPNARCCSSELRVLHQYSLPSAGIKHATCFFLPCTKFSFIHISLIASYLICCCLTMKSNIL